ncbi:hypothetical protein BCR35DRAFT_333301 [Leucosporidium creatinivorum]|uniref:Uncharacterized protein n=1 Tax=Leucosporidium creatinivorum TaxID=106004 RepID=A0A1Y2ET72_9BASI|nr:hypothetical protein BCR35DRAFT_333301 [Leucosporidium creatinivorum]
METAYEDPETKRQGLEQSLGRLRETVNLDNIGDIKRITTGLNNINGAMDDVAFAFTEQLDKNVLQAPISPSLKAFARQRAVKGFLSVPLFLASVQRSLSSTAKLDNIAHPFLKVLVAEELFKAVLGAFHPLISERGILQELEEACISTGSPKLDSKTFLGPMREQIGQLVKETLAWQALHRRHYLYTDFDLLFPI